MPTYRYRSQGEQHCESCREGFEVVQALSDSALTVCPDCGVAVRRVVGQGPVCVTSQRWNEKRLLSDDNLRQKGFKKLVKQDNGQYVDVLRK